MQGKNFDLVGNCAGLLTDQNINYKRCCQVLQQGNSAWTILLAKLISLFKYTWQSLIVLANCAWLTLSNF